MPRPARQLLLDLGPQALGTWVGVGQQSSFRKRRWVPGVPRQSATGPQRSPTAGPRLVTGHRLGALMCWGGALLAGRGVGPQRCAGASSGWVHTASLSLVLELGR